MLIGRQLFEAGYFLSKPFLFCLTKKDPEKAHELFIEFSNRIHASKLEDFLLDCPQNDIATKIKISNAAGLNKNGDIHPLFFKKLGFDRVVIGTVTKEPYEGNPRPRTCRFPDTSSLVNWMGLPGIGAYGVSKILESYGEHEMLLTLNVSNTPNKKGEEALDDIYFTTRLIGSNPNVDRVELNLACPNTKSSSGNLDARKEYQLTMRDRIRTVNRALKDIGRDLEVYIKVSPDLEIEEVIETAKIAHEEGIVGIVTTNTTTDHNPIYIPNSPGKGGASGNAVYHPSLEIQKDFFNIKCEKDYDFSLIACGGINSKKRMLQRVEFGAGEIQIYTPLIFRGPKLLRELRDQ